MVYLLHQNDSKIRVASHQVHFARFGIIVESSLSCYIFSGISID